MPELNKVIHEAKGQWSSNDRVDHYMSQLKVDLKWKLYELYRPDFDLFGYDPGDTICKTTACVRRLK